MNRLRYIFLSLLTVLSLSGCVGELVSNVSKDIQSGEKILVDFSIVLPDDVVKTKALEETPTITTLHLAVFDDAGYLVEYAEANKVPVNVNEKTEAYTVTLTLSNAKRIIHFIANSVEIPKYGTEVESIGSMVSTDQWDIYWQRKVLEKGITKGPDGKLSDQTRNDLSNIGLVRNFSKLTMSSIAEGFEPLSFYMAKERRRGTVAPYNTATGRFIDNYQTYSSLADLQTIGYDGFIPEDTPVDEYIPATTAEFDAVATPFGAASDKYTNFHYLYERETPVSYDEQPFIIVKGNRGGKGPFYYKISLNNADGKSFPILRNFNYGITIKTVSRDGNDTPLKAASSSGSGDISTSMDPTLINISDGTARLFVSYTDTLLVSGGNIKFRYRYLPDVSAGTSANGILANPETATNAGVYFDVVDKNGNVITANSLIGNVISNVQVDDADKTDGYREVTLTIKDPSATTEWQYLRIYGQKEGDGSIRDVLYRTISFQLMQKQPLIVRCVPKEIELEQGTPITIQTGIPAGFGKAQFPMDIAIEAVNLTLTPNGDNLPVQTGKSLTNSGKPAFWFIRTITYDEYAAMATETVTVNGQRTNYKFFDSHFKSNTAASASQVVATNRYFLDGSDSFTNYTPNVFTPVNMTGSFQAGRDGGKVTLTFNLPTLPSQGDVTILLDGADLDPAVDQPIEQVGTQVVDGKTYGKYIYKPNNTGNQTIKLVSTDQNTGIITAKLSAYHYSDASATVESKIWFLFRDDFYDGVTTNGLLYNEQTRITWYVHYSTLTATSYNNVSKANFRSTVTVGGNALQGYATDLVTIDGQRYVKFVSSYNYDQNSAAYFQSSNVGSFAASFTARDNSGNTAETTNSIKVRNPYMYLVLEDDWYDTSSGLVTVWGYCERGDLGSVRLPIYNQSNATVAHANPAKTATTKVIDGLTYYAYQASCSWYMDENSDRTYHAKAEGNIPGPGTLVYSNEKSFTFDKLVKGIYAADITIEGKNRTGQIVVTNNDGTGRTLTYTSSDPTIATVDNAGRVTSKKKGSVTITVTAAESAQYYGASATATVNVTMRTQPISASDITIVGRNKNADIVVTGNDGTGRTLSYSSSNTNVVTVNNSGRLTSKDKGTATITINAAESDLYEAATTTISVTVRGLWVLVTNPSDLTPGTYIITGVNNNVSYALNTNDGGWGNNISAVSLGGQFDEFAENPSYRYTITGANGSLQLKTGDLYLYISKTGNTYRSHLDNNNDATSARWTAASNGDGLSLKCNAGQNRYLRLNIDSGWFGNVTTEFERSDSAATLYIYKYVGE